MGLHLSTAASPSTGPWLSLISTWSVRCNVVASSTRAMHANILAHAHGLAEAEGTGPFEGLLVNPVLFNLLYFKLVSLTTASNCSAASLVKNKIIKRYLSKYKL